MVLRPLVLRRNVNRKRSRARRPGIERVERRIVLSPPTVTGLIPSSGPEAGGTLVTISGASFTGASAVDFGTTAGSNVDVVNDTTITADSPAGIGVVNVTVTAPGGTSAVSPADEFTYTTPALPSVTGLSPSNGLETGGTMVTITGTSLTGATTVDFGTTAATNVTVVNDTSITADSPAGTGTVAVTVTTPVGTSTTSPADQFTYTAAAAPTVTGLTPSVGSTAGGTLVTITGTDFTGATAVDFGTTAATNLTVVNDTTLTADSPAGTGVVNVTVTSPAGTSSVSPADEFTYAAPAAPAVTGVSPMSGPAAGGTLVTITGTSFTGATAVDFATVAATNVTVVNDTTITADSPAGTGTVDVTVTTPVGTSTTSPADQFTYIAAPDGHGPEPDQRLDGRRDSGDDHRNGVHRCHCGRLRYGCGDECHRGERHHDHGRQPCGHRHGRRHGDDPRRHVGDRRPPIVHLYGCRGAYGHGY